MQFASSLSIAPKSKSAEEQVVAALREQLGSSRPDLVVVFASHHHGEALENLGPRLLAALQGAHLIGCTGESIIGEAREVEQGPALSVWAACLPETTLTPFDCQAQAGPEQSAQFSELPRVRQPERASVLILAEPFSFPMDEYLTVLNRECPGVPVIGGMASGGMGPGQNLLFSGRGMLSSGALGIVLEGATEVQAIVSQGCRPVGKPWVVTACQDYQLQKLGGRPSLEVLIETLEGLEERDRELFQRHPFIGLAFDPSKSSFEHGDFLVRGILGVQAKEKSFAVAEGLRRGMTIQFLVRDARSASEDLTRLLKRGKPASDDACGALLFSCNGRGTRMFPHTDHDIQCVKAQVGAELPVAGFFAMGEIGPVSGRNYLHGFTASVALFRRRK